MNIAVLCGGTSSERDVSLVTGEQVCKALRIKGNNAILLDVFIGHENMNVRETFQNKEYEPADELAYIKRCSKDIEELKSKRASFFGPCVIEACTEADIVFMALHGANGEDGRIQAAFDLLGIRYTGSDYLGSAMAMNKAVTKQIFKAAGVPVAKSISMKKGGAVKDITEYGMDFPVVVKTNCGGSSIGVYIAENEEEYRKNLEEAFLLEDEVIIESYIKGREFSVGVIEYESLPVIEISPKEGFYNYENKYKKGATVETCPAELSDAVTKKIQHAAEAAARSLGLSVYCRVDILTDQYFNCYCLEANTLPGMTPTSLLPQEAEAVGMDFPELCQHLVEISMKKY